MAAYSSARNQEIRSLDWSYVLHDVAIELVGDDAARKPGASWRVVPLVTPLASLLHQAILFHEARHTAATWLDHAGVSPKVASEWMGHKAPAYQPGAATTTLRRYTHVLPGELELARNRLDQFLTERTGAPARCSPKHERQL